MQQQPQISFIHLIVLPRPRIPISQPADLGRQYGDLDLATARILTSAGRSLGRVDVGVQLGGGERTRAEMGVGDVPAEGIDAALDVGAGEVGGVGVTEGKDASEGFGSGGMLGGVFCGGAGFDCWVGGFADGRGGGDGEGVGEGEGGGELGRGEEMVEGGGWLGLGRAVCCPLRLRWQGGRAAWEGLAIGGGGGVNRIGRW